MIKYLLIFLLMCQPLFASYSSRYSGGVRFGAPSTPIAHTDYTQDANCVGAWLMTSEDSETDVSGNSATLTEYGSIETSSDVPSGYSGTSRNFTSSGDEHLYMADGGSTDVSGANQSMTWGCWVKRDASEVASAPMSKYDTTDNERAYIWYAGGADDIDIYYSSSGSDYNNGKTAANVIETSWTHVMVVYNDTDLRIYINGVLSSNGAYNPKAYTSGLNDSAAPFSIGGRRSVAGSASFELDGLIDEAIMFDRALSADEVLEIYTYGIDGTNGGND